MLSHCSWYLTLCDRMDCSPPGSSCPWDPPGKNIEVGCHALLQGVFLIQGADPGRLHRQAFFTTEPPGKPAGQSDDVIFDVILMAQSHNKGQ